ncbi:MAG: D-aminoacyl-tRNA deacylase, partial [Candidatus Omnitrophica bacterium]|nr:D-aminoacyl-tRNA deacylase [Candidatus Omnitrophota bacterium]
MAVFVGFSTGDNDTVIEAMAQKIVNLRIFENEQSKLDYSLKDKNYQIICISNFTLYANTEKGRRPSFEEALDRPEADKLFRDFVLLLEARGLTVARGAFGEHMDIRLTLDGPVNIILES